MPHTALFVVDIQAGLADDSKTQITHAERIRHVGQAILSKARAITKKALTNGTDIGLRIVFVQHHETGEEEGSLLKGSKAWELVFKPQDEMEYVVEKIDTDTFISNPQLANDLKSEGIGHIVVFGIQSEYCVKSTCEGALAAGFRVSLLQGAHSTYDVASRKAEEIETEVEETLRKAGVEIVPWRSWHAGVEKELK